MNAQSNHPIRTSQTRTTDPQLLGPEAGQQAGGEEQTYDLTATYSPDDNKLRLSSATRLDRDVYDRVKAAGFAWAPKQDQFIASMWTPARADLCIELAGEIGDDDTSLIDRAEDRAERFDDCRDKRTDEAERATAQEPGCRWHPLWSADSGGPPLRAPRAQGRRAYPERHAHGSSSLRHGRLLEAPRCGCDPACQVQGEA